MTKPGSTDTLDNLLEGFQIVSTDWTYRYVNPAAASHGRRTVGELLGRKMWEAYPGIEHTPLFETLRRCMVDGAALSFEYQFTFPDGTSRWFEVRVQRVPEGICIHSIDIQDRKDAEAAVREQSSFAAIGRMSALVAHEVKNPLAGLSGALQVLKSRRPPQDPEVRIFDEMLASIRSLDRLVRDLLVFAKPLRIQSSAIAIADLIADAVLVLANDESVKRHRITQIVEGEAPMVVADGDLLKSVFRNLLLNAAQAMPDSGAIDIRIDTLGTMCHVTVTDTGSGVPAEIIGRLFEPFATGKRGGTGLGLSTSRQILRMHGGDLSLAQTSARGATFLATIPVTAGPADRSP